MPIASREIRLKRRPVGMPKPTDFHEPPPDKRTVEKLKVREAKGEIIVCRAPDGADRARAAELEKLLDPDSMTRPG